MTAMTEPTELRVLDSEQSVPGAAKDDVSLSECFENTLKMSQDWKPGSRCRAVFSEDGLVYPAMVLWVEGQRCRVRFDNYNNEEDQDINSLLNPDKLYGPSRANTKCNSWRSGSTSTNSDGKWRRRSGESQGERVGERRTARRDNRQTYSWVKERSRNQSKSEREADKKKTGNQQRDEAEKHTHHNFSLFLPFPPPPPQSCLGDSLSFIPPPPPIWMFGGKESSSSAGVETFSSILMLWYMCGFYAGSYMAQQLFRSTSKE